jgi:hypothetical protein
MERYKETHDDDPFLECDVEYDTYWDLHPDGTWVERWTAEHIERTAKLVLEGNKWKKTRIPDMVMRCPDGTFKIVDNKFKGDRWRKGQKKAYGEIEKQQGGDGDPQDINPKNCDCKAEGAAEPVKVYEKATEPGVDWIPFMPVPLPVPVYVPGWLKDLLPALAPAKAAG